MWDDENLECSEGNQSVWDPAQDVCEPEPWRQYAAEPTASDASAPGVLDLFMGLIGGDPRRRY